MNLKTGVKSLLAVTVFATGLFSSKAATPPKSGDEAKNFVLKTLDDKPVELHNLTAKGQVALVLLRGWPGYQCPLCTRQVNELVQHAADLKKHNLQLLFVYPGPAENLKAHAQEFLQNKNWPKEFLFVTDPDYAFTVEYGLRWDAPNETAYPSTFVIDRANKVRYAHISHEHGDRTSAADLHMDDM